MQGCIYDTACLCFQHHHKRDNSQVPILLLFKSWYSLGYNYDILYHVCVYKYVRSWVNIDALDLFICSLRPMLSGVTLTASVYVDLVALPNKLPGLLREDVCVGLCVNQ